MMTDEQNNKLQGTPEPLVSDDFGKTYFSHGLTARPRQILIDSLDDKYEKKGDKVVTHLGPYAFHLESFDDKNGYGTIYGRESGQPAPHVELHISFVAIA